MATKTLNKPVPLHDILNTIHTGTFKEWPEFGVGDTIKVHYKIVEGDKQRIQVYEGFVISIRGEGMSKSIVVRRISHEVGVERIFPYHSPSIDKIEIIRKGKVRRAKLFYLRGKTGKEGRIKEAHEAQAKMIAEKKAEKTKTSKRKVRRKAAQDKAAKTPAAPVAEKAPATMDASPEQAEAPATVPDTDKSE